MVYSVSIQNNMPKTTTNLKNRKVMKRDSNQSVVPVVGDWHVSLPFGFFN